MCCCDISDDINNHESLSMFNDGDDGGCSVCAMVPTI